MGQKTKGEYELVVDVGRRQRCYGGGFVVLMVAAENGKERVKGICPKKRERGLFFERFSKLCKNASGVTNFFYVHLTYPI